MEFVADDQIKLDGNNLELITPTGYGKKVFDDTNREPLEHFMTANERMNLLKLNNDELNEIPENLTELVIKRIIDPNNEIGHIEPTKMEEWLKGTSPQWKILIDMNVEREFKPYNEKWMKTNGYLLKIKDQGDKIIIIAITQNNVYTNEYPRFYVNFYEDII
jgi:hypothetical protein